MQLQLFQCQSDGFRNGITPDGNLTWSEHWSTIDHGPHLGSRQGHEAIVIRVQFIVEEDLPRPVGSSDLSPQMTPERWSAGCLLIFQQRLSDLN